MKVSKNVLMHGDELNNGQPAGTGLIQTEMPALDTTSGFVIYLLFFGVAVFIIIGLIAVFTKTFRRTVPLTHCPHCNCEGKFDGWGNFRCRICDHDFVINTSGKIVPSLAKPLLGQIALWLAISAVYILISPPRGNEIWPAAWWIFFFLLCLVIYPAQRKNFPKD